MMGDLVVAEHVDVDRRASFAHVVDHALHRHVAGDDRGERAQQRVAPAAFDPRLDTPSSLARGGHPLASDLDDRRVQGPDRLTRPREVAEIAGTGAALLAAAGPAHRQDGASSVTREQVAVAGAVVGEQAVAVGMGALDRRRALRMVRHQHLPGRLVDPPERRHVDRRAVQDPALTDPRLGRPPCLPRDEAVAVVAQPSMEVGHVTRPQRPPEHAVRQAVELDEHHTGDVGDRCRAGPLACVARGALIVPDVVVDGQRRPDRGGDDDEPDQDDERGPESVDGHSWQQLEQDEHEQGVEDDRSDAERQHRERHDQERQRRPDDGVGDADHEPRQQGVPGSVDREAGHHECQQPQREAGDDGDHQAPPQHEGPRRAFVGRSDHGRALLLRHALIIARNPLHT